MERQGVRVRRGFSGPGMSARGVPVFRCCALRAPDFRGRAGRGGLCRLLVFRFRKRPPLRFIPLKRRFRPAGAFYEPDARHAFSVRTPRLGQNAA